ncbi:MAG TPA: hypothetical protein VFW46_20215 [Stellaceae bacterium]|nr:hypothetical protein [Stellaceae bacterium]
MTTIVYRDGIIAADTGVHAGHDWRKPDLYHKIARLQDGSLFAGAGDTGAFTKLQRWLDGSREDERPSIDDNDVIVVDRATGVVTYYTGAGAREVEAPFIAIGSGMPPALGALHHGATAEEAVRIACMVDPWSREPIDVVRLRD